jgi:hypothetical protein
VKNETKCEAEAMAKEAYYFSHDSNARHDPKITAMRGVYGMQGYGWFWTLVEMMREADGYKLDMKSKYAFNAYAIQTQSECNAIASFVHDCINEFELFASDGDNFWSESLLRRMELRESKSEKARNSAKARWSKESKNANAIENDANALKIDAKSMQGKERKVKENDMHIFSENVTISEDEYQKLIELIGSEQPVIRYLERFEEWIVRQTPREQKKRKPYLTVRNWYNRDIEKGQATQKRTPKTATVEIDAEREELLNRAYGATST